MIIILIEITIIMITAILIITKKYNISNNDNYSRQAILKLRKGRRIKE